jgi:hypothetical protein
VADRIADTSAAPPVAAWFLAALLVLAIVGGVRLWVSDDEVPANPFLTSEDCAVPRRQHGEGPRIVAVGTSLLGSGVDPAAQFQAGLQGARWRSCWAPGGRWRDAALTMPLIFAEHPDVLLIHEGLLQDVPLEKLPLLDAGYRKIRRKLGFHEIAYQAVCGPEAKLAKPEAPGSEQFLTLPPVLLAEVAAWIVRFEAQGTQIIVLDIPRSAARESGLGPGLVQRRAALKKLAAATGAQYWSFASPDGAEAYCGDGSHMKRAGRQQFESHLAERLRSVVVSAPR